MKPIIQYVIILCGLCVMCHLEAKPLKKLQAEYKESKGHFDQRKKIKGYKKGDVKEIADAFFSQVKAVGVEKALLECKTNNWPDIIEVLKQNNSLYTKSPISEYDEQIAESGLKVRMSLYERFPKTIEKDIEKGRLKEWGKKHPYHIKVFRKNKSSSTARFTMAEMINLVHEEGAAALGYTGKETSELYNGAVGYSERKKNILAGRRALQSIKSVLLGKGRTIVDKEEGNIMEAPMRELVVCLDAPKMAGVKEWVAKWFPDHEWVDTKWPSEEEIEALKSDILYGKIPFNNRNQFLLEVYLGRKEYINFVKTYNGEK